MLNEKEDMDTLQKEKEKLRLSRTTLSKVIKFRREIKKIKETQSSKQKDTTKKYNSSFHSTTKQKTDGKK